MENDPELQAQGKYLGSISKDFAVVADTLKDAAYQVKSRGFSDYPIFPISKTELPIGQVLISRKDLAGLQWNYYVTYLDEFVQRNLIEKEKQAEFKKVYKDPEEFCCLFVVDGQFTNFIYIPYPED